MTRLVRTTCTLLVLAALNGGAQEHNVNQSANGPATVLAGTTHDLHWRLYRPGARAPERSEHSVSLTAPPGARVLGAEYEQIEEEAILAFRSNLPLSAVYARLDEQLREQGFASSEQITRSGALRGTYERGDENVELHVIRSHTETYHVILDLSGASATEAGVPYRPNSGTIVPERPYGPPLLVTYNSGLRWQFYRAGALGPVQPREDLVRLALPRAVNAVREPYLQEEADRVRLPFDTDLPVRQVFDHLAGQLTAQGFELASPSPSAEGNGVSARYTRDLVFVELRVQPQTTSAGGRFVATLDYRPSTR
ncbi:hypothetical protein [Deinococcus peraridilitoris]|uniref:Uncharacterized protein n=1 Tax=Deinococcus peraridilitoris (strain DSM 19664 / LMG 22246 / CIP 109416 / KR-200) TaxID=937777 RepID=L0A8S3_DEIPD|nr:hypothetical protein [Deinococcus peraridilitoris]AFZ69552.1 hypothetical protein Deipe_4188 [Deinococcus peraridilitoris DSM 19664]